MYGIGYPYIGYPNYFAAYQFMPVPIQTPYPYYYASNPGMPWNPAWFRYPNVIPFPTANYNHPVNIPAGSYNAYQESLDAPVPPDLRQSLERELTAPFRENIQRLSTYRPQSLGGAIQLGRQLRRERQRGDYMSNVAEREAFMIEAVESLKNELGRDPNLHEVAQRLSDLGYEKFMTGNMGTQTSKLSPHLYLHAAYNALNLANNRFGKVDDTDDALQNVSPQMRERLQTLGRYILFGAEAVEGVGMAGSNPNVRRSALNRAKDALDVFERTSPGLAEKIFGKRIVDSIRNAKIENLG